MAEDPEAVEAPQAPVETYLGDGLYASFDGWQFTLRAPRAEGDHYVALEPEVMVKFVEFVEQIVGARG